MSRTVIALILASALVLGVGGGVGGALATEAIVGASGAQGPAGADGRDGADGTDGADGLDGAAGRDGVDGRNGADGRDGAAGARGPAGATGATGAQGPTGAAGAQGPAGATGPAGDPGPAGPVGPVGPQGTSGLLAGSSFTSHGDTFTSDGRVVFDTEVHSDAAGSHLGGDITVTQSGLYRLAYDVAIAPATPATISIGANVDPSFVLTRNGVDVGASRTYLPVFNTNIALVLTLRTVVHGGSLDATGYYQLSAGDVIRLSYDADGYTSAVTTSSAHLVLERIG